MLTMGPCVPAINPTRRKIAPLPVPAVAMAALDALLDFAAPRIVDGPDHRPEWTGDVYRPSTGDLWGDRGYTIGAAGQLVDPADAFPDATARELLVFSYDYAEANHLGFSRFAEQAAFDAGLAGRPCERPDAIPGRFTLAFELGWSRGDAERAERERIDESYYNTLDWDREYELEQHEIDRLNREIGGWDRAGNLALI